MNKPSRKELLSRIGAEDVSLDTGVKVVSRAQAANTYISVAPVTRQIQSVVGDISPLKKRPRFHISVLGHPK